MTVLLSSPLKTLAMISMARIGNAGSEERYFQKEKEEE
jgi:hypothetical protein